MNDQAEASPNTVCRATLKYESSIYHPARPHFEQLCVTFTLLMALLMQFRERVEHER